jgi:hypothetical protein
MSEVKAIETETEIEVKPDETVVAVDGEAVEAGPIEIKVEDGDQPAPRKVGRIETRLRNKTNQVNEAQAEAQRVSAELEAANAKLDLLELRDKQRDNTAPKEDDFDDPQEFNRANTAFNDSRVSALVDERVGKAVQQNQQQTYQANQSQEQEKSIGEHYQRADSLNVTNYDELEGNAMSILGQEFVKTIIATTDNSEKLIASIGASPGKAAEIAALAKLNPARAFAKAVSFPINSNLNGTPLNTPSPETKLSPGENSQLSGWELKLDKAREKAAINGDFSYIKEVKNQAKAAGVTIGK